MAYLTLEELKEELTITDARDDDVLDRKILLATAIVDRYTRRVWEASADTTRKFSSVLHVHGPILKFDKECAQITTVTNGDGVGVTVDTEYVTKPYNAVVDSVPIWGVELLASSGKSWRADGADHAAAIDVLARWASSVTAPDDIVWAATRLAAIHYRERDTLGDMLPTKIISPDGSVLVPAAFPDDVAHILKLRRKVFV